ncbi:MAG: DPP IV N-terminal domain-containing protein, partial [Anaerolineaceae bacterium]
MTAKPLAPRVGSITAPASQRSNPAHRTKRSNYIINNTDSLYPRLIPQTYPKVGTTNSASRIGVVRASGGTTTWFDISGDPRDHYI